VIVFLCNETQLSREWLGYYRAFGRRGPVLCWGPGVQGRFGWRPNRSAEELLSACAEAPRLVLHPDGSNFLPRQLEKIGIPTACFQIDTHAYLHRRLLWAMLFDYVFAFQPGYESRFAQAGHLRAFLQPHAVELEPFLRHSAHPRVYDVGWVGQVRGPLYTRRQRTIPDLARSFRMNDWQRSYSYEEMAEVYGRSKIGLNISRDDYPEAANLRVFEIMAAGALLITSSPSELEKLGFQSGTHFVGYNKESGFYDCVRYYLEYDAERKLIAAAGRELVLKEHTYDRRVEEILRILEKDRGQLFAPARSWPEERVRQVYLDYYCANNLLGCAFEEFRRLAAIRPAAVLRSLPPVLGGLRRALRSRAASIRLLKISHWAPKRHRGKPS
jgi:hypothetical protein